MNFCILVMAKAPVPGAVKTRLRLAPEDAARLQGALLLDTVHKARALAPTTVAGAPGDGLGLIRPLLPDDVALIPQPEGDLGEKMLAGAQTLFRRSPDPVLILGTDAPVLPPGTILDCARALDTHDLSLVPSADGGYVLLGLRRPVGVPLSGIAWSTAAVYGQTLARARRADLSVHEGAASYDVDEPEDLARLAHDLRRQPDLAPRTAELLGTLAPPGG